MGNKGSIYPKPINPIWNIRYWNGDGDEMKFKWPFGKKQVEEEPEPEQKKEELPPHYIVLSIGGVFQGHVLHSRDGRIFFTSPSGLESNRRFLTQLEKIPDNSFLDFGKFEAVGIVYQRGSRNGSSDRELDEQPGNNMCEGDAELQKREGIGRDRDRPGDGTGEDEER
jgi:hypothetical protein